MYVHNQGRYSYKKLQLHFSFAPKTKIPQWLQDLSPYRRSTFTNCRWHQFLLCYVFLLWIVTSSLSNTPEVYWVPSVVTLYNNKFVPLPITSCSEFFYISMYSNKYPLLHIFLIVINEKWNRWRDDPCFWSWFVTLDQDIRNKMHEMRYRKQERSNVQE